MNVVHSTPHQGNGSSSKAESTTTIGVPAPVEDEEQPVTSAADSYASDLRWQEFMSSGEENRLDKIIGIFKDEPLMEALMERIREDRRLEAERAES